MWAGPYAILYGNNIEEEYHSMATPYNPAQQPYHPPGQAAYPPQVAYGYQPPQDQSASALYPLHTTHRMSYLPLCYIWLLHVFCIPDF